MDLAILKKKISSYRTPKGQIRRLPVELLGEILHAWEQWTGPASGFYKEIGADYRKMGSLMGRQLLTFLTFMESTLICLN